jgi:hypothetical protein
MSYGQPDNADNPEIVNYAEYEAKLDQYFKNICSIHKKTFENHEDFELFEDNTITHMMIQKTRGHFYHSDQIKIEEIKSFKDLTRTQ